MVLYTKTVRRPNILFCISDDQSYPHASIYGCKFVQTPTFDRIAQEGILFHNAFVSSPELNPVGDHPGAVWPSDDPVGGFGDLGGSPTKTYMWKNRKKYRQVYKLAFGKRLAEELYNIRQDPYNMNNLANDPKYNEVKANPLYC